MRRARRDSCAERKEFRRTAGCARADGFARVALVVGEPALDGAVHDRHDDRQHCEDRQRGGVQPGREQRPASDRDSLRVDLHEVDQRGHQEGAEPEARRQLQPHAWRMSRDRRALRDQQPAGAAGNRARLGETPREAREHQRDRDLHDRDAVPGSTRPPRRASRRDGRSRADERDCGPPARRRARAGLARTAPAVAGGDGPSPSHRQCAPPGAVSATRKGTARLAR